ncbi:MAG TPA: MrtC family glutamic-type intramembrane protease [Polyangiaceae bacterium]|nr:MrtC family glutamic-type intramembrane protease [Polyangiaceae bacterium]
MGPTSEAGPSIDGRLASGGDRLVDRLVALPGSPAECPWAEALWASADVTLAVGAVVLVAPPTWHTSLVAFVFLAAAWLLVWRHDDARVRRAGLTLGGLLLPGHLDVRRLVRDAIGAAGWALGLSAAVAVPYLIGWRAWWQPRFAFALSVTPGEIVDETLGQLLVIALPEEAFYRGYLQSRFDDAWPPRWRVLGARVGPGLLAAAAVFALGHVATVQLPTRLAVFFPALVFGWLRARTGGIGASVAFHAFCNLYSQLLGRGYGVY